MENGASPSTRPLIVTRDQDLLEQLLRLCAAAGVTADLVESVERARQPWARASAVLVGDDLAPAAAHLGLARREGVVVVSAAREQAALWRLAVELRADDVVLLPAGQLRLAERLSDLADGPVRGTTVALVGGSGGAGSSTLAGALALTAAKRGRRAHLIDVDALGGGIDLVVGCEDLAGLRWPQVAATHGRVSAAAFRDALPTVGDVAVLSFDRSGLPLAAPAVVRSMIGAAQRGAELVVVDLPRRLDDSATEALLSADALLVVATSEVRGVASAQAMLPALRELCADIRVLVRDLPGSDLTPQTVADALGLPLCAGIPSCRRVTRSVNAGLGPLTRGGLERACRLVLEGLDPVGAGSR